MRVTHGFSKIFARWVSLSLALALGACDSPTDSGACDPRDPQLGRPDFDLVEALRSAGATVEELGERFDLKAFIEAPTEVLAVNGEEVLQFRFCTGDLAARALGFYGVGVYATDPPMIPVANPDSFHLFLLDRVLAEYDGTDGPTVALLTAVMGPEIVLP